MKNFLKEYTSNGFIDRIKAMINSGTYFTSYDELYNSSVQTNKQ